jgi:hypothetical protein
MQWQPRESPISSNSTEYIWPYHLRACLSNSRNYAGDSPPSGSGSYRRSRAQAVGCADLAPANLAPLTSKINPPPICYSAKCSASTAKEIRPLANHTDFVSGHFLAEETYLVV